MKNKSLVLVAFLIFGTITGYAATRNVYQVPLNQKGDADSYALPCTVIAVAAAANTAVTAVQALDEAGMVYWLTISPATAGDYVVLRDSGTANTSSTAIGSFKASSTNATTVIQFNPPIAVSNGLSINVSSQTTSAVVCVREADGDL